MLVIDLNGMALMVILFSFEVHVEHLVIMSRSLMVPYFWSKRSPGGFAVVNMCDNAKFRIFFMYVV